MPILIALVGGGVELYKNMLHEGWRDCSYSASKVFFTLKGMWLKIVFHCDKMYSSTFHRVPS